MGVGDWHNQELLEAIAAGMAADRALMDAALSGPVRKVRTLLDCPPHDYSFAPWLESATKADQDFVFAPTRPDTGPFAQSLASAITPPAE